MFEKYNFKLSNEKCFIEKNESILQQWSENEFMPFFNFLSIDLSMLPIVFIYKIAIINIYFIRIILGINK